jgi:NAD(P)-dependent dehydrogenase (short-subunit alcohol dehydrogenase family)
MKNYLIIGASSGIGKELAQKLYGDGHHVFATYNENQEESVNDRFQYHKLNVLDDDINIDFLPDKLDGLAYCPGNINLRPFARLKPESFTEDFKLQVLGAIKVIQAALPRLKNGEGGSIVMFSTVAVQTGFNFHSQVSTSKGAIEGLTRALAAELAPTVRVNCIAPSLTNTPLASKLLNTEDKIEANAQRHPLKRIGQTKDLANAAKFLLSDESSWVTGQVVHIDGGMSSIKS